MQVSKRLAQNMIEFMFITMILIPIMLVIVEVALFWQDVNSIYNLNAEINANVALLDYSGLNFKTGDEAEITCPAATKALEIMKKKASSISLTDVNFTKFIDTTKGEEPFALYQYTSGMVNADGQNKPQISLWVDCRNPFEDGVTTQIEFFHKTLIMKASIPRIDNPEPIVIIPDNIFIASSKLNTMRHY